MHIWHMAHGDRCNRASLFATFGVFGVSSILHVPGTAKRSNKRTSVRMYMIAKDTGLTFRMLGGNWISTGSCKAEQKG
jgi:hypothetical protein